MNNINLKKENQQMPPKKLKKAKQSLPQWPNITPKIDFNVPNADNNNAKVVNKFLII